MFQAGQYYTTLALDTPGGFVPRPYSIAGSPLEEGVLEFYVALVDNGQLTPTLFAQELGAKFYVLTPKGKFTVKAAGKKSLLMVATGTGLAPFVGQVRTLWKAHQSGVPMPYRVVLFYGVAYADEFGYRQELEGYAAHKKEGFDFTFICTFVAPGIPPAAGPRRCGARPRQRGGAPCVRPASCPRATLGGGAAREGVDQRAARADHPGGAPRSWPAAIPA